jgi:hypothetical protein
MILVFFRFPITGVQSSPFSPLESKGATAAAEIANTIEWLMVYR